MLPPRSQAFREGGSSGIVSTWLTQSRCTLTTRLMPRSGGCGSGWPMPALPSLATRTHRQHRPHVSLAVAESLAGADPAPLRSVLMSRRPALSLYTLSGFPGNAGVLFLGAAVTAELLAFHADVHAALGGQPIRHWAHYLPGNWIPHCALAEGLDGLEAGRAFGLLADYQPITAEVASAGIKDTATGAITLLAG